MKYLSFTFDDGRHDNYEFARPILNNYGFVATIFCTTAYIDGTWQPIDGWKSAERPISVEELKVLQDDGWEIALHGDKHITEVNDLRECIRKIENWNFASDNYGFSLPNSNVDEKEIKRIINSDYGKKIGYIRRGRSIDTSSFKAKIEYIGYTFFKSNRAYRLFNDSNFSLMRNEDKYNLPSVVIKMSDSPDMIVNYINSMPDNIHIILMLHSILPEQNPFYGRDSYCWSTKKFENFCDILRSMCDEKKVTVCKVKSAIRYYR